MEDLTKTTKKWIKLMDLGSWLGCHQIPERSFFIKGHQFPICARCTGVVLGQFIALITIWFLPVQFYLALLLLLPLLIDWSLQYFFKIKSNNCRRFITGVLCGFGCTYIYKEILCLILSIL